MIPNMYKIAVSCCLGVSRQRPRAVATHALSIFGDHQDVMACRQTGFAMLASSSVQEVMDLGCIAHLAAIKSRVPFLHFLTVLHSHEIQRSTAWTMLKLRSCWTTKQWWSFAPGASTPSTLSSGGRLRTQISTSQGREAAKSVLPSGTGLSGVLYGFADLTGRSYKLFDYYGDPEAKYVIVAMASVCDTIVETVDYRAVGASGWPGQSPVYRPFSAVHLSERRSLLLWRRSQSWI